MIPPQHSSPDSGLGLRKDGVGTVCNIGEKGGVLSVYNLFFPCTFAAWFPVVGDVR